MCNFMFVILFFTNFNSLIHAISSLQLFSFVPFTFLFLISHFLQHFFKKKKKSKFFQNFNFFSHMEGGVLCAPTCLYLSIPAWRLSLLFILSTPRQAPPLSAIPRPRELPLARYRLARMIPYLFLSRLSLHHDHPLEQQPGDSRPTL